MLILSNVLDFGYEIVKSTNYLNKLLTVYKNINRLVGYKYSRNCIWSFE